MSEAFARLKALAGGYTLDVPDCAVKLNQNENPWDWPTELKQQALARANEYAWNRYPPFSPDRFTGVIADAVGVNADQVLVGNGSNELLYAIFAGGVGAGQRVVIPQPTFTVYGLLANIVGAEAMNVPLTADLGYDADALLDAAKDSAMVVIANPNNPTGCVVTPDWVRDAATKTDALWVIDEAYFEFFGESCIDLTCELRNVIVLRTFSKAMATAGLRFGFSIAHPETTALLAIAKLPYNLGVGTMAAVEVALEHRAHFEAQVETLKSERDRVAGELAAIAGVKVYPTRANFMVFETAKPPREVWQALAARDVLVRDVSKYPMLGNALRVSVGTPDENATFLAAIKEVLA